MHCRTAWGSKPDSCAHDHDWRGRTPPEMAHGKEHGGRSGSFRYRLRQSTCLSPCSGRSRCRVLSAQRRHMQPSGRRPETEGRPIMIYSSSLPSLPVNAVDKGLGANAFCRIGITTGLTPPRRHGAHVQVSLLSVPRDERLELESSSDATERSPAPHSHTPPHPLPANTTLGTPSLCSADLLIAG